MLDYFDIFMCGLISFVLCVNLFPLLFYLIRKHKERV